MPDWLFWVLYIGVPVLILLVCGVAFAWAITTILDHYAK